MQKIKTIIVDDEKHCITTLSHLITNHFSEIELIAAIQDSEKAYDEIIMLKPDLVFMDIEMPVLNGFELLQKINTINFKVIFTTAYDNYAIRALKLNALDYLLKPIDKLELRIAIDKYINQEFLHTNLQTNQIHKLNAQKQLSTIAISTSEGLNFLELTDIIYLEASNCYTIIHIKDGTKHLVSKTLAIFEEILDATIFFRAHKSFLINLQHIKKYIRGEGGEIIMNNKASISLSRNKKQEFLDLFSKI